VSLAKAPTLKGFLGWLAVLPPIALAIGFSAALHSALIWGVSFSYPDEFKAMREKALDIVLVNAKSAKKPTDAQALAQANLDGGGNTDENRRVKTPLPPTHQQTSGSEIERMQRRIHELDAAQQKMLSQAKTARAVAAARNAAEQPTPSPNVSGLDLAESARAMARLEGEISKSVDEYNKRPRKKFVGARTEEYRFAQYIEDWRQKVERLGTLNYPEAARGKLYGSLVLTVSLNHDGSLNRVDINRSSGYKVLDEAAKRIVQMASPFSPFPPEIRRDTDILEITRTWYFTQGDQVTAK
jgi:periplasmic protein TonB